MKKADLYVRSGTYSTQLVENDRSAIEALYRSSGFTHVKVTSAVKDTDKTSSGQALKVAIIDVTYTIDEGEQQKFGEVDLSGVGASRQDAIKALLSAETGQPFSLITLSNDRDAVLSYYLAHGFDLAQVEIQQQPDPDNKDRINVTLAVSEGHQVTIDHVLLSGLVHTKPAVVQQQMLVHAEDPLDQAALLQTQRNLYNLALFNEVNTAVQNPTGNAPSKNVLVQLTEAKRWDVTYGFGFEAQTGTPALVPGETQGKTAAQNGKAGVSPRGIARCLAHQLSRNAAVADIAHDLRPAGESGDADLQQSTVSGRSRPYRRRLRWVFERAEHHDVPGVRRCRETSASRRSTRRPTHSSTTSCIAALRSTLTAWRSRPNLIPQLSQPVTVGGPGITYFHDTRDPSPVDAQRGQYYSIQEFLSSTAFGAETDFNRLDMSYSSYYTFGAKKYMFARNTRIGFENTFGVTSGNTEIIGVVNCQGDLFVTNATCNPVPLPERMYARRRDVTSRLRHQPARARAI